MWKANGNSSCTTATCLCTTAGCRPTTSTDLYGATTCPTIRSTALCTGSRPKHPASGQQVRTDHDGRLHRYHVTDDAAGHQHYPAPDLGMRRLPESKQDELSPRAAHHDADKHYYLRDHLPYFRKYVQFRSERVYGYIQNLGVK